MHDELSSTMRDYLAEIYRLWDRERGASAYVGTSMLADALDVSAPAVNRMVTRLKELDLLEHEPYQGIRLTERGQREALKELRRHRIAEVFLVQVMGFGWHEVHTEANRIGRALGEVLTERMAEMAGCPTHCPHGEPIPDAEGHADLPDDTLLSDMPEGGPYRISRVLTRESDRLEYIAALGLLPGVTLHLLHTAPFKGPIQLRVGEEYRIIGHNLAEYIRVENA
jgi:DtxR family transcriptional regulator, Mn-dependent transcriptional regulator